MFLCATKGVCNQLVEVFTSERREHDVMQQSSGLAHGVQLAHQRVCRIHFIVPIGADQQ